MSGCVAVVDINGVERLYDSYTLEPLTPPLVEMRFDAQMLGAAKQVVEIVGTDRKIQGIKIIRSFTGLGLRDAQILWELAEKQTRVPF